METILALDPGVTTGYCYGLKKRNNLYLAPGEDKMSMGQMYQFLMDFVGMYDHGWLIYEDFQYRNYARMGLDLTPVKIIGIIELFLETYEPLLVGTKQSAATGKAFFSDDRMKEMGVYKVGKKHGRDATRHLLQWANFGAGGKFIDFEKLQFHLLPPEELIDMIQR
jgi:hypothetical protein